MREIVMIERETVIQNGKTVLSERKYHGFLLEDGSIRLLAFCGKRFPLSRSGTVPHPYAAEEKKGAA